MRAKLRLIDEEKEKTLTYFDERIHKLELEIRNLSEELEAIREVLAKMKALLAIWAS